MTAVRDRRPPGVPGSEGRRALALAQQITEQMTMAGEPPAAARPLVVPGGEA